jgi:hypothetical protein
MDQAYERGLRPDGLLIDRESIENRRRLSDGSRFRDAEFVRRRGLVAFPLLLLMVFLSFSV